MFMMQHCDLEMLGACKNLKVFSPFTHRHKIAQHSTLVAQHTAVYGSTVDHTIAHHHTTPQSREHSTAHHGTHSTYHWQHSETTPHWQ